MPDPGGPRSGHVFSVDVEDWFQVNALEPWAPRTRWPAFEDRVVGSTDRILELLARHNAYATFFTLGWVAERHRELVHRIAAAGHEVASHGWWHRKVTTLSPNEFREDVRASRAILEEVTGAQVLGFRAPSFSILPGMEWAFDILIEEGYTYDSSLFPIRRPGYGWPGSPPGPHWIDRPGGRLLELPLATTVLAGLRLPAAGGGYLRQLPYALVARAFRQRTASGEAGMFYVHPWEVDPEQPRLDLPALVKLRHYRGLDRMESMLERLLAEFPFTSAARRFGLEQSGVTAGAWAAPSLA